MLRRRVARSASRARARPRARVGGRRRAAARTRRSPRSRRRVERLKAEVKRASRTCARLGKDATRRGPGPGADQRRDQPGAGDLARTDEVPGLALQVVQAAGRRAAVARARREELRACGSSRSASSRRATRARSRCSSAPRTRPLKFPGAAAYAALTPEALTTQRFANLTTYAGRRNAAKDLAITPQSPPATTALFADLSFDGGALVAFLDGKVKYLNRKDLGLAPTDPLVAGPASKSPLLQPLSTEYPTRPRPRAPRGPAPRCSSLRPPAWGPRTATQGIEPRGLHSRTRSSRRAS